MPLKLNITQKGCKLMPQIQNIEGNGSHLASSFKEDQQNKMKMHVHLLKKEVGRDMAKENPRHRIGVC
jgi:hypothetical protein